MKKCVPRCPTLPVRIRSSLSHTHVKAFSHQSRSLCDQRGTTMGDGETNNLRLCEWSATTCNTSAIAPLFNILMGKGAFMDVSKDGIRASVISQAATIVSVAHFNSQFFDTWSFPDSANDGQTSFYLACPFSQVHQMLASPGNKGMVMTLSTERDGSHLRVKIASMGDTGTVTERVINVEHLADYSPINLDEDTIQLDTYSKFRMPMETFRKIVKEAKSECDSIKLSMHPSDPYNPEADKQPARFAVTYGGFVAGKGGVKSSMTNVSLSAASRCFRVIKDCPRPISHTFASGALLAACIDSKLDVVVCMSTLPGKPLILEYNFSKDEDECNAAVMTIVAARYEEDDDAEQEGDEVAEEAREGKNSKVGDCEDDRAAKRARGDDNAPDERVCGETVKAKKRKAKPDTETQKKPKKPKKHSAKPKHAESDDDDDDDDDEWTSEPVF